MTNATYTYKEIFEMIPYHLKERYGFSHHKELNLINVHYKGTHSAFPIADIYRIDDTDVVFKLFSYKYAVTIFKNTDLIMMQVF